MRLGIYQQYQDRRQVPQRSAKQGELDRIDAMLQGELSVERLRSLKDQLLQLVAADPSGNGIYNPRIARINLRLDAHKENLTEGAGRQAQFLGDFYDAAQRLLDAQVFDMLCRAARAESPRLPPALPVPPAPPCEEPAPLPEPRVFSRLKATASERVRAKSPAPSSPPLAVPMHELVVAANHRPLRFDPTALFKEYGRERVLATWNCLPSEQRPETAAGLREILRRNGATAL